MYSKTTTDHISLSGVKNVSIAVVYHGLYAGFICQLLPQTEKFIFNAVLSLLYVIVCKWYVILANP